MQEESLRLPIATPAGKEKNGQEPGQIRVSDLKPGEGGQVMAIDTGDEATLRKMTALGIFPGTPLRLLRRFPAYVFETGYRQIAVDEAIACKIYVCREKASPRKRGINRKEEGNTW
ncbi:MAG: ferrous iron transport protein A [Nitrospinota bacterium]|nr:MAG: ferrous iron transport protein A [Nitrospinota bacterium]